MSFHLTDNYKRGSSRQGYSENDLIFTFSNRGGIFRSHLFLVWSWCKCFFERFFLPLDTVWIGLFSWLIVHCIQRHITLVKLEPRLWCNCGQMAYKSIIIRQVYIYRYFLQVNLKKTHCRCLQITIWKSQSHSLISLEIFMQNNHYIFCSVTDVQWL